MYPDLYCPPTYDPLFPPRPPYPYCPGCGRCPYCGGTPAPLPWPRYEPYPPPRVWCSTDTAQSLPPVDRFADTIVVNNEFKIDLSSYVNQTFASPEPVDPTAFARDSGFAAT